jgi:hypothetical protein
MGATAAAEMATAAGVTASSTVTAAPMTLCQCAPRAAQYGTQNAKRCEQASTFDTHDCHSP